MRPEQWLASDVLRKLVNEAGELHANTVVTRNLIQAVLVQEAECRAAFEVVEELRVMLDSLSRATVRAPHND